MCAISRVPRDLTSSCWRQGGGALLGGLQLGLPGPVLPLPQAPPRAGPEAGLAEGGQAGQGREDLFLTELGPDLGPAVHALTGTWSWPSTGRS